MVILKQILIEEKQTFKDFLESDEAIATNILSSRLKMLEEFIILTKDKRSNHKKINIYHVTERGGRTCSSYRRMGLFGVTPMCEIFILKFLKMDRWRH